MTMSFESLFPVVSRDKLGMEGGAGILGGASYLMVGFGSAAMVTALLIAGIQGEHTRGRLFLWLGVLSGLTPVALAMSPNLPLAVMSAACMGAAQGGFMTLSHAMIQSIAPDAIRGRLMGVYSWHIQGFMASFNLVNGTLATMGSLTAPMILAGGGIAFIVVIAFSFSRVQLRDLYARGVPPEARVAAPGPRRLSTRRPFASDQSFFLGRYLHGLPPFLDARNEGGAPFRFQHLSRHRVPATHREKRLRDAVGRLSIHVGMGGKTAVAVAGTGPEGADALQPRTPPSAHGSQGLRGHGPSIIFSRTDALDDVLLVGQPGKPRYRLHPALVVEGRRGQVTPRVDTQLFQEVGGPADPPPRSPGCQRRSSCP